MILTDIPKERRFSLLPTVLLAKRSRKSGHHRGARVRTNQLAAFSRRDGVMAQAKVFVNTNNDLKMEDWSCQIFAVQFIFFGSSGESPRKWLCDTVDSATQWTKCVSYPQRFFLPTWLRKKKELGQ